MAEFSIPPINTRLGNLNVPAINPSYSPTFGTDVMAGINTGIDPTSNLMSNLTSGVTTDSIGGMAGWSGGAGAGTSIGDMSLSYDNIFPDEQGIGTPGGDGAGGMPEASGWGSTIAGIGTIGKTLIGAFNAWTNYEALEETKERNEYLQKYGTAEFNTAAQVYNQDREDFLARTERAKGVMTQKEADTYAEKRMETESVARI